MPLGIVSDEEFDAEIRQLLRGRSHVKEVPQEIRKAIASTAINGATNKEVVEAFGVSQASVMAYKNGATSTATYHEPNEELNQHVKGERNNIESTAKNKLMAALEALTTEKIQDSKARDIAGIAKDMSAIVKNLEPEVAADNSVKIVMYSPRVREEADYEIIVAKQD